MIEEGNQCAFPSGECCQADQIRKLEAHNQYLQEELNLTAKNLQMALEALSRLRNKRYQDSDS